MAGQCKSCLSPNHNLIDERLLKGESCESLSAWLRGQDEMISPPSILRHRKNHVVGMKLESNTTGSFIGDSKNPPKNAGDDDTNEMFIDTSAVLARIASETADTNIFTSVLEERKFTQLLMERIVQNQLVIVHELQQQYTAGKSGYPDSQIRGLKTILDITNALPTYADKMILRKLADNNEELYVNRIRQSAIKSAKNESEKYEEWAYVRSIVVINVLYENIREYAEMLHPIHTDERNEWIHKMNMYWMECFEAEMPCEFSDEAIIKAILHKYLDQIPEHVSDEAYKKYNSILVEKIIERFKEPYLASESPLVLHAFLQEEYEKLGITAEDTA